MPPVVSTTDERDHARLLVEQRVVVRALARVNSTLVGLVVEGQVGLAPPTATAEDGEAVELLRVAEGVQVPHRRGPTALLLGPLADDELLRQGRGDLDLVEAVAAGGVVSFKFCEIDGAALVD